MLTWASFMLTWASFMLTWVIYMCGTSITKILMVSLYKEIKQEESWHSFTVLPYSAFFEGYKFLKWTKKGNLRKPFSWIYIGAFSSVCNPCHDRIPQIFGETNFVEVPKIHKICSTQTKVPYCIYFTHLW